MTAPARHSPADAARPPDRLYGLVRLGNLHAAIPIDAIREVVPRPAELLPFPATMPRIIGAIEVRGAVIPVLDLADLLNAGARRQTPEIIMLLRQGEQVFGVEI
jgi:purine-binding chemotaxis protein CheW